MLIDSWMDMATQLVFAFGVLQGMDSLKELLEGDSDSQSTVNDADSKPAVPVSDFKTPISQKTPRWRRHIARAVHYVIHHVGPMVFVMWGLGIAGIHFYAEWQHTDHDCRIPLRPWLGSQPGCSLVEIDCHKLGISGNASSLDTAWRIFDPSLAAGLIIQHCPERTIPSSMAFFKGLTSMKTYNSTISWPETSGLTSSSHGRLRALYLIRTNFTDTTIPPGLLRKDFPQSFGIFYTSVTNLASLPKNLDRVWPQGVSISIEYASFTAVPDVVLRLSPRLLSLSHCPIASLPARLFEIPTLRDLFLCNTAIRELPQDATGHSTRSLSKAHRSQPFGRGWIHWSNTRCTCFLVCSTPMEPPTVTSATRF